jgi:hypothetical protein
VSPGHLLCIRRKDIKEKINVEKITFYTFNNVLDTQVPKQNFLINMLEHVP